LHEGGFILDRSVPSSGPAYCVPIVVTTPT
jgi:hypothetical protein